jgi:hypothetical protein
MTGATGGTRTANISGTADFTLYLFYYSFSCLHMTSEIHDNSEPYIHLIYTLVACKHKKG